MKKNHELVSWAAATSALVLLAACGGGGGGGSASTPPPPPPAGDTFAFNGGTVTHASNGAVMTPGPTPADTRLVVTGCTNTACTDQLVIATAQLTPGTVTVNGPIALYNVYAIGSDTLAYINGNNSGYGSGTLTLTAVGGVGELVTGSFDYMMCSRASNFTNCSFHAVGSFSVKRVG